MNRRRISWEIVVAGLTFTGIAIFLLNQNSSENSGRGDFRHHQSHPHIPSPPEMPFPGTMVIDLENITTLQNLKNLKNLKSLENLRHLETELENLDRLMEEKMNNVEEVEESVNRSLENLEKELQKIEEADFRVKLQDRKLYIDKDYDVQEGSWSEVSPGVFVFRQSFPASGIRSMDLKMAFGNINVVGADTGTAEITIHATGDVADAGAFDKKLTISKTLDSPEAAFRVRSGERADISDRINMETTLTIPGNVRVKSSTSGGHISASHLSSTQDFRTSGGHITLNSVEGRTKAETGGGHITGEDITGELSLKTAGGHITIRGADGSIFVRTGGGHINMSGLSGSVEARTSGGNISASMLEAGGPLKFTTSAGNVKLLLPQNISADLDITGTSINLAETFDLEGQSGKGTVNGTINGGGVPVVINCGFGNVNIAPNEKK